MIKPMLAKEYTEKYLRRFNKVYWQNKLDGMRMCWDGYDLWSRGGKKIVSVPGILKELREHFEGFPLDGEGYCHGMSFQKIRKCLGRTKNIEDNDSIVFVVYDKPIANVTFEDRWALLTTQKDAFAQCKRIQLCPTHLLTVTSYDIKDLNPGAAAAYEGTMLRNGAGLYKFGKRSADLLKVKEFFDVEFTVVGITELISYEKLIVDAETPGSKKYADGRSYKDVNPAPQRTMGSLICKTAEGLEFEIGSGFTDEERQQFWDNPPIGKMVTGKYQELSDTKVPRFCIYKCLYDPM